MLVPAIAASLALAALATRPDGRPHAPQVMPNAPASVGAITGRPSVTDGDTVRIDGAAIRFWGIDAPELTTDAGQHAKRFLTDIVRGDTVRCEDTGGRSYHRVVAVCYSASGRDLSAQMVEAGWATDWPRFSGGRYADLEREARAAGRGLFSQAP